MENTGLDSKDYNNKRIFEYVFNEKKVTASMIESHLGLSRPTVSQSLRKLINEDRVIKNGFAKSTGGRKASMYSINHLAKVSIGIEIVNERYEIIAVDLFLETLKYERYSIPFSNTDDYYGIVCNSVNEFIYSLKINKERIAGVGIALQALISSDGKEIIYGKILSCTGLNISTFTSRIPYPCNFYHDGEALANVELWLNKNLKNAIFLNVRENLSGALIIGGSIFNEGNLKNGIFEHMTMIPGGKRCYCGKDGCINMYCSLSALLEPNEHIDVFYNKLRMDAPKHVTRWEEYLSNWAIAIDNLRMFLNDDVVIGGQLSTYLMNRDVEKLEHMVSKRSAFPGVPQQIEIARSVGRPICLGAAIPQIREYIKENTSI